MIELATPEDRLAAAGEYVLGTLSASDHASFSAALERDDALRAAVYGWQDRLLGLSLHAEPVVPEPQLWQRIERSSRETVAPPPAPTPALRRPAGNVLSRWWQRGAVWQAAGAAAVGAMLMAVVLVVLQPGASNARYLAVLQSPGDQSAGWIVEVEANRHVRLVPISGMAATPPGKALQFWTKPVGAAGPTSLGLVRAGQTIEMPVSRLPGIGEQQLFEITLEPENGSPTGRPTGPILYVGRAVNV